MPRKWISYEMLSMFVGSGDAFSEAANTGSSISRLDFIQDYAFSFDVERQALKQIGSFDLATNSTQLAPDVNLRFSYYLNDGWNEDFLGFNINSGLYNNFIGSEIFNATNDRNFYIAMANDNYSDSSASTSLNNYNILGIGNTYINSYNISVSVGQLATVSCDFIGANATISTYSGDNYMPSVDTDNTGQTASGANKKYGIELLNASRLQRYISGFKDQFNGGCPSNKVLVTASEAYGSDAIRFGELFNNIQSLNFSLNFERKALYGFGNNHPFARKLQRPIGGSISLDTIVDSLKADNLAETFAKEDVSISGLNFNIIFKNQSDIEKFGIGISGAKLDSYEIGAQIAGQSNISTNWSFYIKDGSEVRVSGSRPNKLFNAVYANESINPTTPIVTCSLSDVLAGDIISLPSPYANGGGTSSGDYIDNITIIYDGGTIFSNSTLGVSSYLDLTSIGIINMLAGQTYSISYTHGPLYKQGLAAYMQNSSGQWVKIGGSPKSVLYPLYLSFLITLPTNISGSKRLIFRCYYQTAGIDSSVDDVSFSSTSFGQRKDFRVCVS